MPLPEAEIGKTLRTVRRQRKWTQSFLAFRLKITIDELEAIESGRTVPTPELSKKIQAWLVDANARLA
jgi:transcriptional regulator with XRE-family HTH domain